MSYVSSHHMWSSIPFHDHLQPDQFTFRSCVFTGTVVFFRKRFWVRPFRSKSRQGSETTVVNHYPCQHPPIVVTNCCLPRCSSSASISVKFSRIISLNVLWHASSCSGVAMLQYKLVYQNTLLYITLLSARSDMVTEKGILTVPATASLV